MRTYLLLFCLAYCIPWMTVRGQDAPVTTAGNVSSFGISASVDITVSGFNAIGSCGLQLNYDPSVAAAVSVATGPLLGGNLNSNLTVPGTIVLGWYTFPGISLPDNSVAFTITFNRVRTGACPLTWIDSGYSCYYSDTAYQILNDLPSSEYYINGSLAFLTEAPVTIAPAVKANPGSAIDIPVRVAGFGNIGRFDLAMTFDPSVLTFQSWTNTSGFPGFSASEPVPGTLLSEGTVDTAGTAVTLADSSVLYTLHFLYSGGATTLAWKTDSCGYVGPPPFYPTLYDFPENQHYIPGSVFSSLGSSVPPAPSPMPSFYPNPFRDRAAVSWVASNPGQMEIDVVDAQGKTVASFLLDVVNPGRQSFEFSSDRLAPGLYTFLTVFKTNGRCTAHAVKAFHCH